ncbi:putative methylmalonyl-coenzyme a mutase [Leptomonas pyrrhocoris]|uniref:Putative methylmalonyl-coenzyme a mutase n=1 Tax=Leptomonas pyrrhocoris TaxID=157538 RepID=A0A0M9G0Q3_LEPPY|nr:putative methylmalonyl-coenzyme a mutase [Leptomonas pyrrhocoris]XP_015658236.1 putative methylmalonyl-coenzyme a mutase [Leptomonas pyrrhocoris]XP_015658237.1 putative methylmalonyl-coenzyme a mutase [Leptomonas pyrrhocoris]KPA79796.1 putative methylmalonyl-coenzyme a mutase [Leptomonas pyrrhocoris]KPA79797.1 putative methylmalonyl-coenzyme a mutase [Leptomonas pyrrhocoris]KPA79798.1 putative methylmalonyl-coenzyme a mutase [Leptomonas pyrrhocoris]|eukprot:XP_015658235.1 putative methylmalonyl-coenzyme a mutase [Leptomonas pyrrhocoris]
MRRAFLRVAVGPPAAAAAAVAGMVHPPSRLLSTTLAVRQNAPAQDHSSLRQNLRHVRGESKELRAVAEYTHSFAEVEGRRPRILLCTFEDCSQGRPDDKFATVMADLGFDVDIGPSKQAPEQIARQAVEADVHGVHVSVLSDAGAAPLPHLVECLKQDGAEDVFVTVAAEAPPANMPRGAVYVKRGDFVGVAQTIMKLLHASDQPANR